MGPDEYPSREELGLVVRLMFAKFRQQAKAVAALTELLQDKGLISNQEILEMVHRLEPESSHWKQAMEKLREFAAIHSTARHYLDHLEEDSEDA